MPETVPAETLHALLRAYAAARWPKADADHEATNLAADPVYGGDPELVNLADAAYAAGRASVLEGAVEQWAVVYGDHSHYRVSGSTQALQLAATARSQGGGEAYAAHRLLPEWQRMEADRA